MWKSNKKYNILLLIIFLRVLLFLHQKNFYMIVTSFYFTMKVSFPLANHSNNYKINFQLLNKSSKQIIEE